MSFSQEIKAELETVVPNARHCLLAEITAINTYALKELTKDTPQGRKAFTLQAKTSMIKKYVEASAKNSCCQRAYLRGAFLTCGSISNPEKSYRLEFVCDEFEKANLLLSYLNAFDIEGKITDRRDTFVLYVNEAESIVDILNIMGAHKAVMMLESLRVEKDFRNLINRKVNCEAANIAKAASAAHRQIEDIELIKKYMGLDRLPEALRQMALVRLEHAESSLQELGGYLDPPVGKSGVNHRLRKLSEIADNIRK